MSETVISESVWDYPRPPRCEPCTRHLLVRWHDQVIAETQQSYRVLETSHPPTYYFPPEAIATGFLQANRRQTLCEWKGRAVYFDLVLPDAEPVLSVGWAYPEPTEPFLAIANHVAFYPHGGCFVDGEAVQSQPGDFYGGWITADIVGPFKGNPGTWHW